jgi:hypothetical protein
MVQLDLGVRGERDSGALSDHALTDKGLSDGC